MLAHSQGTFCRVMHFRINTAAPAVRMSRVPHKTTKTTLRIKWYMLVFWRHEPEKKIKNAMTCTRTCSYSSKNITYLCLSVLHKSETPASWISLKLSSWRHGETIDSYEAYSSKPLLIGFRSNSAWISLEAWRNDRYPQLPPIRRRSKEKASMWSPQS